MRVRRLENKVWLKCGRNLFIIDKWEQRSKTAMDPGVLAQADEIYLFVDIFYLMLLLIYTFYYCCKTICTELCVVLGSPTTNRWTDL
jgi:hypothetical protein